MFVITPVSWEDVLCEIRTMVVSSVHATFERSKMGPKKVKEWCQLHNSLAPIRVLVIVLFWAGYHLIS